MRFILFLVLLCLKFNAFSETFVVTSNADSGVGTLRDALQKAAANGIGEKDYIHFNLPGSTEAQRTITLKTGLEYLTSNIVIDGTTQAGSGFGISDAKVIIQPQSLTLPFAAFVLIDTDGFELYGCYVRDFQGSIVYGQDGGGMAPAPAIYVENAKNVQIGAPGKGNVIVNNGYIIYTSPVSLKNGTTLPESGVENLKVFSNILGFEPDGKTSRDVLFGYNGGMNLNYCKGRIEIGGADISKRNVIGGTNCITSQFASLDRLFESHFLIQNNYFGYNFNGATISLPSFYDGMIYAINFNNFSFYGSDYYPYSFDVLDNKIQGSYSTFIQMVSGRINFQGNRIVRESYPGVPSYPAGIHLTSNDNVKVGGENSGEPNFISGQQLAVVSPTSILVQRNSIFCVNIRPEERVYVTPSTLIPEIEIKQMTATFVSGTATPFSRIELFWDDDCERCQPVSYITTVDADANGLWKYEGNIQKAIIATATRNGFTSMYTMPILYGYTDILNATCGNSNGSIVGQRFKNVAGYEWTDEQNKVVSNDPDLENMPAGKYRLTLLNSSCSETYDYEILDGTPKFDDQHIKIQNPSCGMNNGSVTYLNLLNESIPYKVRWTDKKGRERGNSLDLIDVEEGTYFVEASYNDCIVKYGPVVLTNQTGPSIDLSHALFKEASCNVSNGSITNVKVTGTGNITYTWKNAAGVTVSTTKDLIGVQSGWYALEVKDGTACPVLGSGPVQVKETNGITIDEANAKLIPVACNSTSGGITGLIVTGATTYKWMNQANQEVGHSLNLTGIGVGKYYLLASNVTGCTKQSQIYEVKELPATRFDVQAVGGNSSYCNQPDGTLTIKINGLQPSGVRWVNASGITVGNSMTLTASAGSYKLYLTDNNNCESFYREFSILNIAAAVINRDEEKVTNDQCNLGKGSIKAPGISGIPPYYYSWSDSNGKLIGSGPMLENIPAGNYSLMITDALVCSKQTILYTVLNEDKVLLPPILSDLKICAPGDAFIQVTQPGTGTYILYNDNGSRLDQNTSGIFKVNVINSQNYFVKQIVGLCESPATKIRVTIENEGLSKLSNAISPNNDGHNDLWLIPDMINYPEGTVLIFNRYGQKVFASTGYRQPFDGRLNGKDLPVGTYYYIIDLKKGCGLLKGSITIIR